MKLKRKCNQEYLLAYFVNLAKTYAATTLWSTYTKLKAMIAWQENIDISSYLELQSFLKTQGKRHKVKKAMVFTTEDIKTFLKDAPDDQYLLHKVVLVVGLHGCLRTIELLNITIHDVTEQGDMYYIKIPQTKTGISKSFVTSPEVHPIISKYLSLRPDNMERFFLQYRNQTCTRQNVGKGKLSAIPKDIATFLKLEDSQKYTGHALRRTSATIAADHGADLVTIKRLGGWKSSTVAESYIDESRLNKVTTSKLIASAIDFKKPCETVTSGAYLKNQNIHQPSTSSHDKQENEHFLEDLEEISSISQIEYEEILQTQFNNAHDEIQQPIDKVKPLRTALLPKDVNIISSQYELDKNELKDCQLTIDSYEEFLIDNFEVPRQEPNRKKQKLDLSEKPNIISQKSFKKDKENHSFIFQNCHVTINNN
uniref:Tyr recombinase domain-containing protein n=1 Tax=Trichogramma kaykai TaxID=54128 RepID=A0ABD2X6F2_9HYME